MIRRAVTTLLLVLAGCAHTAVSVNSGTAVGPGPAPAGTSGVSSGAGLQVHATGGAAAAIVAGAVVVGVAQQASNPQPASSYRSFSDWFWGRPAPAMDPSRTVNEQDCTKPIEATGNLKCR